MVLANHVISEKKLRPPSWVLFELVGNQNFGFQTVFFSPPLLFFFIAVRASGFSSSPFPRVRFRVDSLEEGDMFCKFFHHAKSEQQLNNVVVDKTTYNTVSHVIVRLLLFLRDLFQSLAQCGLWRQTLSH
jgi:hypothetical protein